MSDQITKSVTFLLVPSHRVLSIDTDIHVSPFILAKRQPSLRLTLLIIRVIIASSYRGISLSYQINPERTLKPGRSMIVSPRMSAVSISNLS